MDDKKITAVTAIIGSVVAVCTFLWGTGVLKNPEPPVVTTVETVQQMEENGDSTDSRNETISSDHTLTVSLDASE